MYLPMVENTVRADIIIDGVWSLVCSVLLADPGLALG